MNKVVRTNMKHYCYVCGAEADAYVKNYVDYEKVGSEWLCEKCLKRGKTSIGDETNGTKEWKSAKR